MQIDIPITKDFKQGDPDDMDKWHLTKYALVRMWPEGSPFMPPGTFVYPVKQRWFASRTQMCNEPVNKDPAEKKLHYHTGLDFGG